MLRGSGRAEQQSGLSMGSPARSLGFTPRVMGPWGLQAKGEPPDRGLRKATLATGDRKSVV